MSVPRRPATTILPSASSATANAASFVPCGPVIFPPVPKDVSSVPSEFRRWMTSWLVPASRSPWRPARMILPSDCEVAASATKPVLTVVVPPPKVGSIGGGGSGMATMKLPVVALLALPLVSLTAPAAMVIV
jgi:hypothetical protein